MFYHFFYQVSRTEGKSAMEIQYGPSCNSSTINLSFNITNFTGLDTKASFEEVNQKSFIFWTYGPTHKMRDKLTPDQLMVHVQIMFSYLQHHIGDLFACHLNLTFFSRFMTGRTSMMSPRVTKINLKNTIKYSMEFNDRTHYFSDLVFDDTLEYYDILNTCQNILENSTVLTFYDEKELTNVASVLSSIAGEKSGLVIVFTGFRRFFKQVKHSNWQKY